MSRQRNKDIVKTVQIALFSECCCGIVVCRNDVMSFSICFFTLISVFGEQFSILAFATRFSTSVKTAQSVTTTEPEAAPCLLCYLQFPSCWLLMASDFNTCRNIKSFSFALYGIFISQIAFYYFTVMKKCSFIHLLWVLWMKMILTKYHLRQF